MYIEFDPDRSETVLHLNAAEIAEVLFALDLLITHPHNSNEQRVAKLMHMKITGENYHHISANQRCVYRDCPTTNCADHPFSPEKRNG